MESVLVLKAHGRFYHSTLGPRAFLDLIESNKYGDVVADDDADPEHAPVQNQDSPPPVTQHHYQKFLLTHCSYV